jgi:hypothetical protein
MDPMGYDLATGLMRIGNHPLRWPYDNSSVFRWVNFLSMLRLWFGNSENLVLKMLRCPPSIPADSLPSQHWAFNQTSKRGKAADVDKNFSPKKIEGESVLWCSQCSHSGDHHGPVVKEWLWKQLDHLRWRGGGVGDGRPGQEVGTDERRLFHGDSGELWRRLQLELGNEDDKSFYYYCYRQVWISLLLVSQYSIDCYI